MTSVTEVLDYFTEPELLAWMLREGKAKCERISAEAMRIGKVVDQMIQRDVRGLQQNGGVILTSDDESVLNCWKAWQLFKQEHPTFVSTITGIQTELMDGELVGHPDFEITEPTRFGIVDVKTSKAIQPKHWTQVATYSNLKCLTQLAPRDPIAGCVNRFIGILRLDKQTGQYEYREITDVDTIFYEIAVFQSYLTVYQHSQKIREILRQQLEQEVLDVP